MCVVYGKAQKYNAFALKHFLWYYLQNYTTIQDKYLKSLAEQPVFS